MTRRRCAGMGRRLLCALTWHTWVALIKMGPRMVLCRCEACGIERHVEVSP